MGLILSVLFLGLMASLSPSTIVVFILLLGTTRALVNAGAFLVGWVLSLVVVFTASYALGASETGSSDTSRTVVAVIEILLGTALVVVAGREWRRRDQVPTPAPPPKDGEGISGRFRRLRPWGAVVVGVLKQPWAITTAAALVVVHHHANPAATLIAFVAFAVVSTATVGWIFLYYARSPDEAQAGLTALKERAVAAGPRLFAIAALVVGLFLVVDGVLGLQGH